MKDNVDYIKKLGVDSVWLSPFYKNGRDCYNSDQCNDENQNYDWNDIIDHTVVGDIFGDEGDLTALLTELEMNG